MVKRLVCITGGIGSGKSVVSRALRLAGYPVFDCDYEAKRIMDCSADVKGRLCEALGERILRGGGAIDRRVMADIIFSDEEKRKSVNAIVHGAVKDALAGWVDEGDAAVYFVETAIAAESGIDRMCDAIWLVTAPDETRIERVIARNGVDRNEVERRIASQRGELERVCAHRQVFLLDNGGGESLLIRINELLNQITS